MQNVATLQPLRVFNEGNMGPYLRVPDSQLPELTELLKKHQIDHWVDGNSISIDGGPYFSRVEFGRRGDERKIQGILDAAS